MGKVSEGTEAMINIRVRVKFTINSLRSLKRMVKTFPKKERELYAEKINKQLALLRKHTNKI